MQTVNVTSNQLVNTGTAANVILGLADSGITANTYTAPTIVFDEFGRAISATSNTYVSSVNVLSNQLINSGTSTAPILGLASVNSNNGSFTWPNLTVDNLGRITLISENAMPVISVSGTIGELNVIGTTSNPILTLATTGITANTYTAPTIQFDAFGRAVSASSNVYVSSISVTTNQLVNSGTSTNPVLGLATVNSSPGSVSSWPNVTIDGFGRTTLVSENTTPVLSVIGTSNEIIVNGTTNPILSLATTGITANTYTAPTIQFDAFGRAVSASSNVYVSTVSVTTNQLVNSGTSTNAVLGLATVNSSPGSYSWPNVTIDGFGRISTVTENTSPVLSVIGTSNEIIVNGTTNPILSLATTGISANTYTAPTVQFDAYGRAVSASSNVYVSSISVTANQLVNSGTSTNPVLGLATVNSSPGSYSWPNVTIDGFGRISTVTENTSPVLSVIGTSNEIIVNGTTNPILSLATTGISANTYTAPTVQFDAYGRAVSASSNVYVSSISVSANQLVNSGTSTNPVLGLATVNSSPGSYNWPNVTIDGFGRISTVTENTSPVLSITGTSGQIDVSGTTNPILSIDPTLFASIQFWEICNPLLRHPNFNFCNMFLQD